MSASVAALVEKATNDLLIGPDWGKNLELCDVVNSDPGHAKEAVKAIKKRLSNKSSTVQLLALTLLETLIKNCGDVFHQQVAERDVLHEMVKLVKKRADMSVRDKILVLIDSWQEAFRGKFPQYYAAYNELKQLGVDFPQRAPEELVPIFTPPQTHPIAAVPVPQIPYGQSAFEEPAFPSDARGMSLSDLENARGGLEVLTDMLNAINPRDKAALREELIVDLVEQCRTTQKQVMNLVNTTNDEVLLFQALSLNDDLQKALGKHEALASGKPLPSEEAAQAPKAPPQPSKVASPANFLHEEEESEDDYTQLARRPMSKSRLPSSTAQVPILPPPHQPARISPPLAAASSASSVDLLSGDMYAGKKETTKPAPAPASASSPPQVARPLADEDPDNINPFAIQHRQSAAEETETPWSTRDSNSLNSQQQALLYGQAQNPKVASTSGLPPPPIKHSQRQQFFQQKHHSSSSDEQPSEDDEHLQNPYAAFYAQQQQSQQQQKQSMQQQKQQSPLHRPSNPSDNLFGDLVDLQSARMKAGMKPS